ncbi:putative bolA-like protein K11H12.1 [Ornithodoros turicata]
MLASHTTTSFRNVQLCYRAYSRIHKVGPVQQIIEEKLTAALHPTHLSVENESIAHNVPKGSETHFRVTIESDAFEGKKLVEQHRLVYKALEEEMKDKIRALAIETLKPLRWSGGPSVKSPPCLGGMKNEQSEKNS